MCTVNILGLAPYSFMLILSSLISEHPEPYLQFSTSIHAKFISFSYSLKFESLKSALTLVNP